MGVILSFFVLINVQFHLSNLQAKLRLAKAFSAEKARPARNLLELRAHLSKIDSSERAFAHACQRDASFLGRPSSQAQAPVVCSQLAQAFVSSSLEIGSIEEDQHVRKPL